MAAIDVLAAWFGRNTDRWARQVINTLNANGYSVVKLPNPDPGTDIPTWTTPAANVTVEAGRIRIELTEPMRATEGQALSAALLAAAHALGATE